MIKWEEVNLIKIIKIGSENMTKYNKTIYFMLMLTIYLCVIPFIAALILGLIRISFSNDTAKRAMLLFITPFLCSLIPGLIYFFISRENIKKTLYIKKISLKNIILIVIMAILIQPAANFISAVSSFIFPNNASEAIGSISQIPLWEFILISAILPAVFEECIFRGIILSGCRSTGIAKSAIISGLFFGIMHLDPHQFIYAFLIGIFLGLFVTYTGSIFSSIIAHFTINGTQGILAYISESIQKPEYDIPIEETLEAYIYIFIMAIIFSILFGITFSYFKKYNKSNITSPEEAPPKNIITIPFITIIIIFIGYLVFIQTL